MQPSIYPGLLSDPRRRWACWRLAAALLAVTVVAACGFPRAEWEFHRDLVAVDALSDTGAHLEAREAYLALAHRAPSDATLRYLQYRVVLMQERAGQYDEALAGYAELVANPYGLYDEYAGRAAFRIAELREQLRPAPDLAARRDDLVQVIHTAPNTTAADDALLTLRMTYRDDGNWEDLLDRLRRMEPALLTTEIADDLVYENGRALQEELNRPQEAIAWFTRVVMEFSAGALVDDAVWRVADCYRRMGQIDDEFRVLLDFIDGRETSWFMTDYDSVHYAPTLMRLADILEERGDLEAAIRMKLRYRTTFPLSMRNDDKAYEIMQLQARLQDHAGMREQYQWLLENFPDSRWTRRGCVLLEETTGECP